SAPVGSWLASARAPWAVDETMAELDSLAAALVHRLADVLGPVSVGLLALRPDGTLRLVGAAGVPPSVIAAWVRLPHRLHTPPVDVVHRGRPSWIPDIARRPRRYLLIQEADELWPSQAWLPIRDGNRIVGVGGVLCRQAQGFAPAVRRAVVRAVAEVSPPFPRLLPAAPRPAEWAADTQAVLDILPGAVCLWTPVLDAAGSVVDYEIVAASPGAVDRFGRRGRELVGLRVFAAFPSVAGSDLPAEAAQVLASGRAREVGPFTFRDRHQGVEVEGVFTVRLHRFGSGVLVAWIRHDEERRYATRLALTEKLGNLGWAEWDMTTDTVHWSDQLLAIFGRDATQEPVRLADLPALVVPEDLDRIERATAALFAGRTPMDVTFRIRVRDGVRHVRAVGEAAYDVRGRPVRAFGILRDVTAEEVSETEHRLLAQLQEIILPLPDRPIDRPGLQVAVRYRPAEELTLLGGDWYDLVALPSGATLLAVGDVAGHGLAAAGTMTRLRHALAALAVTTSDPAALLGHLNRLAYDDPAEPTATVVVARYDPWSATVVWAQAGHPPPILVAPGAGRALPRPRGTMVGARRDTAYVNADIELPPEATLLLYTDGLIERRGEDGDWAGPVLAALAGAEREPVTDLLARLRPANPDDDTCVLALRRLPSA
ncbi:MAG TPA: SpoIIE family protein phosphatase, partial [Micromonosporaceae bacterium]|nr:SpoIIE family protein phosphatase [Micromonosporaceae bacterium]